LRVIKPYESSRQFEKMDAINEERIHTTDVDGLGLVNALRGYLPVLMNKHQTPGLNIAVADKGKLIWEAGYGFADISRAKPMTPDSVYHSGSMGKTYTATAVMILVDRGVIALEDPINKHLPFEVHNPLGARSITVRDLMVHMSGLSADGAASSWLPNRSLAEVLEGEYAREWSPMFGGGLMKRWTNPVGTVWTYSNLGVATLGLIVERANPERSSFSDFVQRHIMDALGMTHSCYPPAQHPEYVPSKLWTQTTRGYSRMGLADIPTIPICLGEYPAGGVLARPADHIRLLLAMTQGGKLDGYRLFAPEVAHAMISPATDLGLLNNAFGKPIGVQGLIWQLGDSDRPWASFGHGGAHMFGWRTQGRAWPSYTAAVVVASSQWSLPDDTMDVDEVVDFVGLWLRYRQPTIETRLHAAALSYARGALLAGAYRVTIGISGAIPEGSLEAIIAGTRDRGGDWDVAAFRRGFEAVAALPPTLQAIQRFWGSDASEIDCATAHAAYAVLGGRKAAGHLWNLLPADSV
jgi:CubicO group peptidase (beta-lactamase class C family)